MPQKGDTQVNNFVKGYITEASPLNFPEGASLDEVNMKLKRDGTRERRLGLDYEDSYALQPTGQTAEQLAASRQRAFVWPTPSGFTDVEIGVIQIGTKLYFIDLFTENPSDNVLNSGNAFDASTASSVIDNTAIFDFALINNNLIVVSSGLDTPFILYYDGDTDTISWDTARLEIRDLYGVTDGLDVSERPTALTDAHEYNLRNQGWNTNIVTKNGAEVLTETFNALGKYPSNSDTWSLGKIADVTDADVDKYDATTLERNSFDIGRAARGHYIIDLYNRGNSRETLTGLTMPTTDREVRRVSTVASMGGRLFYSGINSKLEGRDVSPKLSGAVLFSQVASSDADLVKCYQEADPTSPNDSELVDTDGGVIFITEASNIVKIQNTQGSILVFAENGVWEIRGDEGGFRATSFQVNKVSNIGVIARESILDANGIIYFWGTDGIFTMTPNQLGTGYDTVNITLNTIQSAFNTLPDFTKRGVKAYYDVSTNSIRWLFNLFSDNVLDIPAPAPPVFEIGEPVAGPSGRREPETIAVSNTVAFTVYSDTNVRRIYYQVSTIDTTTLAVTLDTEVELVDTGINGGARGWTAERLSDNRIVLITSETSSETKARLITFSGSTPTVGSASVINSVFGPLTQTAQLRTAPIDSERIVVRSRNLTNGVGSMQVVKVVGSTISFGTVVSTSSQNHLNTKVCMLTTTFGMYADMTSGSNTQSSSSFSISDVTITLNTESTGPVFGDFPAGTTAVQSLIPDIQPFNSTRAICFGTGVISNASVSNEDGIVVYKLAANSTDVDIEAATFFTTPTLSETNMYNTSVVYNGSLWGIYIEEGSPQTLTLANYSLGDPATLSSSTSLETATLFERHPEVTHLGNGVLYLAYRTISGTDAIKGLAIRVT